MQLNIYTVDTRVECTTPGHHNAGRHNAYSVTNTAAVASTSEQRREKWFHSCHGAGWCLFVLFAQYILLLAVVSFHHIE